ncbi:MAG: hypothetical protein LBR07_07475 [Puniceicoccales bacterium]|jgi:phosphopantothenoylcysteine decarboxylase/phosphopantothenate--cysteine ligase|nr:hypothetical protein [Puniceicoccales bacterium]
MQRSPSIPPPNSAPPPVPVPSPQPLPRILVTAGPTREFFDPVRFISNPSSGKMGYAIAAAAVAAGCEVELVSGPVSLAAPAGARVTQVTTGAEMLAAADALFPRCDILIMTAAVCDFRPKTRAPLKVKKEDVPLIAEFEPVPDILRTLAAKKRAGQIVVGFAAETDDVETHARTKLVAKKLDMIAANKVGAPDAPDSAFGADANRIILLTAGGGRSAFGPAPKAQVAAFLVGEILRHR